MEPIEEPEAVDTPDSLAGKAAVRLRVMMSELNTSFKRRLDEPITDEDRDGAFVEMLIGLMGEVVSLWRAYETLARHMGVEGFDVEERG